jgi:hypothetical protein
VERFYESLEVVVEWVSCRNKQEMNSVKHSFENNTNPCSSMIGWNSRAPVAPMAADDFLGRNDANLKKNV